MRAMPLRPSRSAVQVCSAPMASGETRPTPVTTTLRDNALPFYLIISCPRLLLGRFGFNVVDRVFYSCDLFGVLVRNFQLEGFFKRHHQLDDVKRIGAKVIDKRGGVVHLILVDPQLLHDDLLYLLLNCHASS